MDKRLLTVSFLLLICFAHIIPANAQLKHKITLQEALQLAGKNNLTIQKAKLQHHLAEEVYEEEKELRIPEVSFHGSYGRMSDLTEYKSGLKERAITPMIPEIADANLIASIPIYQGNRINNSIKKAKIQEAISQINIEKKTNDIQINTIANYLSVYKLMKVQQILVANCLEEADRLKEVKAFKKYGTVTNNDVLRIELQLSTRQLQLLSNQRNISIGLKTLKTTLQISEKDSLELDTLNLLVNQKTAHKYDYYQKVALEKDEMRIAKEQENIRLLDRKMLHSNYYPKINFFASFGFNYPNYLFFPPNANIYNLGKLGLEMVYDISGLYKNRTKMAIANKRVEEELLDTKILSDQISDRIFAQHTRYQEVLDRIPVNQKAVIQATENYRIVRLKYKNQLALMTDLIDADNSLLDAHFNSISTKIDALMHYYELQYAAGLLQSN